MLLDGAKTSSIRGEVMNNVTRDEFETAKNCWQAPLVMQSQPIAVWTGWNGCKTEPKFISML
jgi:hypothetical protein